MNSVFLLIPLGIVLVVAAALALIWAVDSGQYDGDVEENGRIALELDQAVEAGSASAGERGSG
jgi:cbb3-type cytochrome oxidase maturation protein